MTAEVEDDKSGAKPSFEGGAEMAKLGDRVYESSDAERAEAMDRHGVPRVDDIDQAAYMADTSNAAQERRIQAERELGRAQTKAEFITDGANLNRLDKARQDTGGARERVKQAEAEGAKEYQRDLDSQDQEDKKAA